MSLIRFGTVIGFVSGLPNIVVLTDGFNAIHVYVTPGGTPPLIGQSFNVYKQGATYFLGNRLGTLQ